MSTIKFAGNGGIDNVNLTGLGNDSATIAPTQVKMTGTGYNVEVDNCAVVNAHSSGSGSTATFSLAGGDTFVGRLITVRWCNRKTPTTSARLASPTRRAMRWPVRAPRPGSGLRECWRQHGWLGDWRHHSG